MNARRAILGSWPVVAPSLPDRDPCSRAGQEYASRHERRWRGSSTIVYTRVVYRNGRDQELSVLASGAEMLAVRAIEGGDLDETRRNGCHESWSSSSGGGDGTHPGNGAHRGRRRRDRVHVGGCGVRGYDRRLADQGRPGREGTARVRARPYRERRLALRNGIQPHRYSSG